MAAAEIIFICAVSFLAGTFVAGIDWNFYLTLGITTIISVILILFYPKARFVFVGIIFLFFTVLGFFYYHLFLNIRQAKTDINLGQKINFSGVVISQPNKYDRVQVFKLELAPPHRGAVNIMLSGEKEIKYGYVLSLRGVLEPPASKKERPIAFFPETEIIEHDRGSRLKRSLFTLKDAFISQFNRFLPAEPAALISGLTFGIRSGFSADFKEAMNRSGTTHLTALSGYNISILVLAIFNAFGRWLPRRGTFILTLILIVLFVIMTGGEASIVRAGFMGFLALLAKESGRIYSPRNAIALTAFGMAVFDPTVLVYDIGFQLSFLSLLGLVYLMPTLELILGFNRKNPGFMSWKENLLTTASAQIAVLPLLLYHFQEFSILGIVANTLILGFVPYTMFLGFILAGLGFVSYYLGLVFSWLLNTLLVYEISVIKLFGTMAVSLRTEVGPLFISFYYLLIITFIVWRTSKETQKNVQQVIR